MKADDPQQALVSLVIGNPLEPYGTAYARSWLINPDSAEVFAEEMAKRYSQPIESAQEISKLGDREGLAMMDPRERTP